MKKFSFVLTAAFLVLFNFMVFDAHAFYLMGDCGSGVKYELETDSGLLEIYGSGKMDAPTSGYQFADGPELALLHWRPSSDRNNRFVEIWIPVENII